MVGVSTVVFVVVSATVIMLVGFLFTIGVTVADIGNVETSTGFDTTEECGPGARGTVCFIITVEAVGLAVANPFFPNTGSIFTFVIVARTDGRLCFVVSVFTVVGIGTVNVAIIPLFLEQTLPLIRTLLSPVETFMVIQTVSLVFVRVVLRCSK